MWAHRNKDPRVLSIILFRNSYLDHLRAVLSWIYTEVTGRCKGFHLNGKKILLSLYLNAQWLYLFDLTVIAEDLVCFLWHCFLQVYYLPCMCKLLAAHIKIIIQICLEMAGTSEFLWHSVSCKILNTSVGMEKRTLPFNRLWKRYLEG